MTAKMVTLTISEGTALLILSSAPPDAWMQEHGLHGAAQLELKRALREGLKEDRS